VRRSAGGLLVLVLVLASSPASADLEAPSLRIGDFWTYWTNTIASTGLTLTGHVTFRLDGQQTFALNGTPYDVFRIAVQGNGDAGGDVEFEGNSVSVAGTWLLVGEEFLGIEALKIVSSYIDLRADGETIPFQQDFALRVQSETTFEILEDRWRFPVDVGDTGHVIERFNATEDFFVRADPLSKTFHSNVSGVRTLGYRVEARGNVQVRAGTFDAYRINETFPDGRFVHLFFAPTIGNNVRSETFNETGVRIAVTDLESYRYQALESPTFLGLGVLHWSIAGAAGAAIGIALILRRRRRDRGGGTVPP